VPGVQRAKPSNASMLFLRFRPDRQIVLVLTKEIEKLMQYTSTHLTRRHAARVEASSLRLADYRSRGRTLAFLITLLAQFLEFCG